MDYKDLSPELREKVKTRKTSEELLELAKREGRKFSDEEMEAVSGGLWISCSSDNYDCSPIYVSA